MSSSILNGRAVLVVEDDYMIAMDTKRSLERAGAIVLGPVPSVAEALRVIETEPAIDAAVLDVNLGDETSFRVAEELKTRAIPFLFATGYNSADIPPAWQHATIIMKPLRTAAVEQLLTT